MFAHKSRIANVFRIVLIAVILFNALAPTTIVVQAKQESISPITTNKQATKQESRSNPTFERPKPKIGEHNFDNYNSNQNLANASTDLIFGSLFSGSAVATALGPDGSVFITGYTWSADFPATVGAYQEEPASSPLTPLGGKSRSSYR